MSSDVIAGVVALVALFSLEGRIPFYTGRSERYRHGLRNLGLAAVGVLVTAALTPLLVFATQLTERHHWGLLQQWELGGILGTLLALLLFDAWMYAWHRANHRIGLLWRLHRVHHTDPAMDSTTALRFHPGELLLSTLLNALVLVLLGMSLMQFVVYKTLMILTILLHHSNVALPYAVDRRLRWLIVPPSMHRVHHSQIPAETNANYGTVLSLWDRLFRSLRLRADLAAIQFGIGAYGEPQWQTPLRLLTLPGRPLADAARGSQPGSPGPSAGRSDA